MGLLKICSRCKETKPVEQFSKDRTQPSGINYNCKTCRSKINQRSYRSGKPISVKEQSCTACYETKPANDFYADSRGKHGLMSRCKKCFTARLVANRDPEKLRANSNKWRKAHPEQVREMNRVIKARRRKSEQKQWTSSDWDNLVSRFGGCCAYCGTGGKLTLDHVVPLSRGGRHAVGNFLPACVSCNSSKGSKFLVEWRKVTLWA